MDNEFSPDRSTVGPPLIRDGLKDMQKIFELEADKAALISACDAVLDWADANARAFSIETAPRDQKILLWNDLFNTWVGAWWSEGDEHPKLTSMLDMDVKFSKFWRPEPPPPSNPPLPAPLEALGAVLRRVKGVG